MSDLLQDFPLKASHSLRVGHHLVDGIADFAAVVGGGLDFEPSNLNGRIVDIHSMVVEKLAEKRVCIPIDDAGSAEFIREVADHPQREISLCVCDPKIDLKLFDTTFHVRSFASGLGDGWHRHSAPGAKERPATPSEERTAPEVA